MSAFSQPYHSFYTAFYNEYYAPLYKEARKSSQLTHAIHKDLLLKLGATNAQIYDLVKTSKGGPRKLLPFLTSEVSRSLELRHGMSSTNSHVLDAVASRNKHNEAFRAKLGRTTFGQFVKKEMPYLKNSTEVSSSIMMQSFAEIFIWANSSYQNALCPSLFAVSNLKEDLFQSIFTACRIKWPIEDVPTTQADLIKSIKSFLTRYFNELGSDEVRPASVIKKSISLPYMSRQQVNITLKSPVNSINSYLNIHNTENLNKSLKGVSLPGHALPLHRYGVDSVTVKTDLEGFNLYTLTYSSDPTWYQSSPGSSYGVYVPKLAGLSHYECILLLRNNFKKGSEGVMGGGWETYFEAIDQGYSYPMAKVLLSGLISKIPSTTSPTNVTYNENLLKTLEAAYLAYANDLGTRFKSYSRVGVYLGSLIPDEVCTFSCLTPQLVFKFRYEDGQPFTPFPGVTEVSKSSGLNQSPKRLVKFLHAVKSTLLKECVEPAAPPSKYLFTQKECSPAKTISRLGRVYFSNRLSSATNSTSPSYYPSIQLQGGSSKLQLVCYLTTVGPVNSKAFEKFLKWGLAQYDQLPEVLKLPNLPTTTDHLKLVWASFFTLYSSYKKEYAIFNSALTGDRYENLKQTKYDL